MNKNYPDVSAIIDRIADEIGNGKVVCLNIDTADFISVAQGQDESEADEDIIAFHTTIEKWPNKIMFEPVDSEDLYQTIVYFIEDNVREGTRLFKRLQSSIQGHSPYESFMEEVTKCKGLAIWQKYEKNARHAMVVAQLCEEIGRPKVNILPLNRETIELMALAHISRRYFYVTLDKKVIISQVVDQTEWEDDDVWMEKDTHYTLTEWVLSLTEDHIFHENGGGLVYEPIGSQGEMIPETIDLREVKNKIKRAIKWTDDEDREFKEFCEDYDRKHNALASSPCVTNLIDVNFAASCTTNVTPCL